jgi:hypothetical protein
MSIDRSGTRTLWPALVIPLVIGAAVLAFFAWRARMVESPTIEPPLRLALAPPENLTVGGGPDYLFGLALAPDGRRLVFPATQAGHTQLYLRDLSTGELQPLPGTEDAVLPFWAPDGRAIGFFANGRMRALTLEDAQMRDLADAPAPRGGAWHPGGDIIFAPANDAGLLRRRGGDGAVEPFTTLDASAESSHRMPTLVDGGRHVVFFVAATAPTRQGLWIAPTDAAANRKRLIGSNGHAIVSGNALLYSSDGALVAQRLDLETQSLTGRPVLLGSPVGQGPLHQLFVTATDDVVIYGGPASTLRELRWFDRNGAETGEVGEAMDAWDISLAPDGTRVAVTRLDPQLGTLDIWTYDGNRPLPRRISPTIAADESPVWNPGGDRLAWVTGRRTLTVRNAQANATEQTLRSFENPVKVTDWSPDDNWIVVSESRPVTRDDLWLVPLTSEQAAVAYANTTFNETQGVVSPDGKWLAYASDESGRFEIYVDAFPKPGKRARLTTGGGVEPRWRNDGHELYFRRGSEIHAVNPFRDDGHLEAVSSERLFDAVLDVRAYDVSADGQRFLLNLATPGAAPRPFAVLVNPRSLLRFAP